MTFEVLEHLGKSPFQRPGWLLTGSREELFQLFSALDQSLHTFAGEPVHGPINIEIKIIE